MRSLKTKFASTGAVLGVLLVVACVPLAILLRRPGGSAMLYRGGHRHRAHGDHRHRLAGLRDGPAHHRRRCEQLNDSTNRISQGDYTQPVRTLRDDELGDLQRTVDQMRQSLADTTITKNYLDNVLNSMTDAVFVVRNDGSIKFTNLGRAAPDRRRRQRAVRPLHRLAAACAGHSATRTGCSKACEVGEAVLRTESGQTIPVSFSGSEIETADEQFSGRIYRGARHHRPQARRAAHPLPRALRRADQDSEPHAVPAPAAAGHRALAALAHRALRCCTWTWITSRK